jgi:hypothetical protein
MPQDPVVTPVTQTPSVQEMNTQLSQVPQSNLVNNEVQNPPTNVQTQQVSHQTTRTNAAVTNTLPSNGIVLANTPETEEATLPPTEKINEVANLFQKYGAKTLGILLTLQSLHGIYKSVLFILVEYPLLEQQLVAHQITQTQVNDFGIKAIMIVFSTVLSMFFAMKLTFLKTKAAKTLSTVIAVFLFIGNAMIHDYFVALNSSQIMTDFIIDILYRIQGAPEEIIEKTPFLEETIDGTVNTVWYK